MRRLLIQISLLALCPAGAWNLAARAAPASTSGPSASPLGDPLKFAVITSTRVEETRQAWEPFFADLRAATGLPVQGVYVHSYAEAAEALIANRVQVAWLSSVAALECIDQAPVEVFGQLVDSHEGLGYRSLIVTRRDSGITSLGQLLSRPKLYGFAMGEPISTSGHLMPTYALFAPRGIKPEAQFSPLLRGSHAQTLNAVLNGKAQAGTYNTEELERLKLRQPAQAAQLRVLWESTLIPKDPLLWRTDLPLSLRLRLSNFLFTYGRIPEQKQRLREMFDLSGFKASTNHQLKFVLEIEDFQQRSEVLLDTSLDETERNERLLDLRSRYKRLARALQSSVPPERP